MDELIRRQDALDALGEEPPVWYDGEDEIAERNQWRRDVNAIKAVPSAQPEYTEQDVRDSFNSGYACGMEAAQPKTGKWITVHGFCTPGGDPVWACSECGKGVHVYGIEHNSYGCDVSDGRWKACPNCGAMMGGEEHD